MHATLEENLVTERGLIDFSTSPAAPAFWYAMLVASGLERKACIWLRRRQYEPYWPRYKGQVKLNRHRKAERWRSVIPGYLFLPVEMEPDWELFEDRMPGFSSVLRNGRRDALAKIPEAGREGIAQIRHIEAALNASPIAAADGLPFKVGQAVRVPRLSLDGRILAVEKGRKLIVELFFFGAKRPIPLPASEVEAA